MTLPKWQSLAAKKQKEQSLLIPQAWRIDPKGCTISHGKTESVHVPPEHSGFWEGNEWDITERNDAVDIVDGIKAGKWSAEEVTRAFCKRAAVVGQLTNCLTEIMFEAAIKRAHELDSDQKAHKHLGPLHGLPISLKDSYQIPGVDAAIGLTALISHPSTEYSSLPALLLSLGAVLYVKTNVPQTMMTADSHNHVVGRTLNPHNTSLTAGGSSGGEGALIAMKGSVLGFATDLAGSIRIPALCDGVYGFKPSAGVVPFAGQRSPFVEGWEGVGIKALSGPMASSARACSWVVGEVVRAGPVEWDAECLRTRWLDEKDEEFERLRDPKKLRIGVVRDDGLFSTSPPVRRGLEESVEKLEGAGVTVVPIKLPVMKEAGELVGELLTIYGNEDLATLLNQTSEPLVPSVIKLKLVNTTSNPPPPKTIPEYLALHKKHEDIARIYNNLWKEYQLDAIIMPPAPHTAVPHNAWATVSYTVIWNLMDYPGFVVPIGKVESRDVLEMKKEFYWEGDEGLYGLYTGPEDYRGAPIGVQVVGRRQDDQALTVLVGVVDSILNGVKS